MKALTIRQPYAWAVVTGRKTVENRGVRTNYRGPLLIHAGTKWFATADTDPCIQGTAVWSLQNDIAVDGHTVRSAVVAIADLTDCHPAAGGCCAPWGAELYGPSSKPAWHWILANVRPLTPIPAGGALGLWTPPPALVDAVLTSI